MSTSDKPDPARAWMYAMNLLAQDELERLDKLSDEEVEREMRAEGLDPARVPSAEQLLAKVFAREEVERIEKLSDEELDLELRAHGRDPARLPSAEELLEKVAARAGRNGAAIASKTNGIRVDDGTRPAQQERAETSGDEAGRTEAGRDKKRPGKK